MSQLIISFSLCTSIIDTPRNIDGCTVANDGFGKDLEGSRHHRNICLRKTKKTQSG